MIRRYLANRTIKIEGSRVVIRLTPFSVVLLWCGNRFIIDKAVYADCNCKGGDTGESISYHSTTYLALAGLALALAMLEL